MTKRMLGATSAIGLAMTCAATAAMTEGPRREVSVRLTPHVAAGSIGSIGVVMTIRSPDAKSGQVLLEAMRNFAGYSSRYDPDSLRAADAKGALALKRNDASGSATVAQRSWTVARDTAGDVTVSYDAPTDDETRVPHLDLRREGLAASGGGLAFLPSPKPDGIYRMRVSWDLHELPPGSRGVWAWGEGDVDHVGPVEDLANSYYAAGRMEAYVRGNYGFYWFSPAPFDVTRTAASTGAVLDDYQRFFRRRVPSYRVFLRQHGYYRDSGAALTDSFILGYNVDRPPTTRTTHVIAHEMAHTFLRSLSEDSQAGAWYAEGGAEYYSGVLPLRSGTIDSAAFLETIDDTLGNYYPRPTRLMSIDAAAKDGFFTGNSVQQLAYGRGRLYLAAVNSRIKAATRGRNSLDDVTLRINALSDAGRPHDEAVWLSLVERYLGPQARRDHAAFRSGALVVPPSDAFGPCFRRVRADVPAFDLGFDETLLLRKNQTLKGVRPGSPGWKAGLRDGDVVVGSVPLSEVYGDPARQVTVNVRRGAESRQVTFLPRGGPIEAYRWERIPEVPETRCREV